MILTVVGARPQFIKAAALSLALKNLGINEQIIHTGQHYDEKMSKVFFEELGIPGVAKNLAVGSGQHGAQTGEMLAGIEEHINQNQSDIKALLVYGDTNSTLAGAITAAKLHIPIIHVEAGLRSFNRTMPEEINRVITDHISTYLFCSSREGVNHLKNEGITKNVFNVGDIMYDAVKSFLPYAKAPQEIKSNSARYNLITIHRPSNTDDIQRLQTILTGIGKIEESCYWPVHPRNKATLNQLVLPKNLVLCEPFSYFEMLYAIKNSVKVITDSGGLQKEAYWLKKPCITIRPQTEWIETLDNNWNQLCDGSTDSIVNCYQNDPIENTWKSIYGEGNASTLIAGTIKTSLFS